jgi:choline transport protein
MPLAVRLWGRWTGKGPVFDEGSYNLKFGLGLNIIGLLYLAFACITFNFPSVHPITASNMNYTCAAVAVSVLIATVTWFTTGSKGFSGPQAGTWTQQAIIHGQHLTTSMTDSSDVHVIDQKGSEVVDVMDQKGRRTHAE